MRILLLTAPAALLSWLGRQGTRAVAALVLIGIAVPAAGALLKPLVTWSVFLMLCVAFLRVDPVRLKGYLRRPVLVLAATAWTMLAIQLCLGLSCLLAGLDTASPELFLALMLQAVTSPMMASPAFAALMGLDATLVLVTIVLSTALIPFTAPLFAYAFIGPDLALSPLALGLKLLVMLVSSALVGFIIRRQAGPAAIEHHRDKIDGVNILILVVFVAAVMEKVSPRFLSASLVTLGLAALAFAMYCGILGLTTLVFARVGWQRALALGLMVAQRNLGLMLAATAGALPDLVWLYVGLSQFPIYLSPHMLRPLARRLAARAPNAQGAGPGFKNR